jgi:hypothetical protein
MHKHHCPICEKDYLCNKEQTGLRCAEHSVWSHDECEDMMDRRANDEK